MIPYAVAILSGGLSTRLADITKTIPKAMIVVAGKPFIDWQLELLKSKGVSNVVICAGHLGEQIREHVGDGSRSGLEVTYSFDGEKLLGTGGAIKNALPLLGKSFFVMYGDSYLETDLSEISKYFSKSDADALITVFENKGRWDKSNIIFADGKIIKYDKTSQDPDMKYIDYGLVLLRRDSFKEFKSDLQFDLGDVFKKLIGKKKMLGYEVKKRFYEIGSLGGLKETEAYLSGKDRNNG